MNVAHLGEFFIVERTVKCSLKTSSKTQTKKLWLLLVMVAYSKCLHFCQGTLNIDSTVSCHKQVNSIVNLELWTWLNCRNYKMWTFLMRPRIAGKCFGGDG